MNILPNCKYGGLVEFVDYLSAHHLGDFTHPYEMKGRQSSTKSDQLSSREGFFWKIINWLDGGSDLQQINGTSEYNVRDSNNGGMRVHMVNTWLNSLVDDWSGLGINVNVSER